MKVIDLLNKIAKGEEVPKKIKFDSKIYDFSHTYEQYYNSYGTNLLERISEYNYSGLNDEIEVIEEEKDIEEINYYPIRKNEIAVDYIENGELKHFCLNKKEKFFADKINELIKAVNKLKKGTEHEK